MRIKIINQEKCENCEHHTCDSIDTITKSDFMNLKTERYTCPVKMFDRGPTDEQLESGYIDFDIRKNECLYCCLCVVQCSQENLLIEGEKYDGREDFLRLKVPSVSNTIAMSYLNYLFEFAANTNIIQALKYKGVVITGSGEECLVEVDINNDSLESCRRLLGEIILHNHNNKKKIKKGLMVLNDFPKQGSRDVFTLINSMKKFENTSDINIYITTFSLLRHYVLHINSSNCELDDLLFNASVNTKEDYLQKLIESKFITKEISLEIFGEENK